MELILLEKIRNLGDLGDQVRVKPGFGRNYLIPQGKALPASAENVKVFEARKAELIKKAQDSLGAAKLRAEGVADLALTVTALASEEGKLYGSVGASQVAEVAVAQGVAIEVHEVVMPNGVIRDLGDHEVEFHFHPDVHVVIKLRVEAEATA